MGREPILVNGAPVHSPLQLYPSDKIEVQLEGRTRIFYFQPVDESDTLNTRAPLVDVNNADLSTKQQLVKPSPPPPVRPAAEIDVKEEGYPAEQTCDVAMEEEEQKVEEKQPEPHTTPEGAVADATHHFPSNNHAAMANTVAVNADTTIAFVQWAMGTQNDAFDGRGDTDAGPVVDRLPPAIPVSTNKNYSEEEKEERSNDGSPEVPMHPPLSSIKPHTSSADLRQQKQQTPAAGILFSGFKPTPLGGSSMQGRRHTFSSGATPGTEYRPAAPAPTPATAFQVFHNNNNMYDPKGLAEKLNHIAGAGEREGGGGGEGSTPRMPAHNGINNNAAAAATPGGNRLGFMSVSACKPPVFEVRSRSATIQSNEEQHQQQQDAIAQSAMMVTNSAAGVEVMQPLSFSVQHLPVPHTAGRSRLAMQGTIMDGGDDVDADVTGTAEVVEMEGTAEANGTVDPSPSSLAVVMEEDMNGEEDGAEGETSAEKAAVPELTNNGPSPFAVPPPPSASHHQNSRRKSSMRTPGTKIVIIERDSSVKMNTGSDDNGNNSCPPPPPPSLPPHSSNGNVAIDSNKYNNVYTNRSSNNNNNRLIRQFDQATPGSIKPLAIASRLGGLMQSNNKKMSAVLNNCTGGSVLKMKSPDNDDDEKIGGDEDEEMEISLAPMAAEVHQEESPLEKMEGEVDQMLATVEKPAQYTVVGTIVEQERMGTVEREKEEGQQQQQQEEMGMIPLAQYKSMVLKARAHRTESLQLANALHKMTAKALRLKKSADALGDALNKETKKRVEVQNVLQQIVENRFEEEEDDAIEEEEEELVEVEDEEEGEMMDVDDDDEEEVAGVTHTTSTRVIVVGHVSAPPLSNTIRAGQVVVVRPYMPQPPVVAAAKTPRTNTKSKAVTGSVVPPVNTNTVARGASAGRKRKSSVSFAAAAGGGTVIGGKRRLLATPGSVMVSSNHAVVGENNQKRGKTPLKVDNVELPGWLYTEQKEPTPEIARHLQMVAAEEISADGSGDESEEEEKRGMSPEILGSQPLGVESGEEDEEEEDMCHVCGESDEGDVLLLCDDCDNACHLGCCNPPLKRVPKGNWYCVECKGVQEEEKNKGGKCGGGGGKKAAAIGKKAVVAGKRGASVSVVENEAPKAKRGRGASVSAAAPTRSTRSAGRR